MFVRSFSATKDNTCNTMSLRKVPIRSLPRRVSSCGKSTLLKSLNRMNDLVEGCRITGEITLDGADIYGKMDVNLLRRRVGMVFQKPNPFPMSIYDNIAYGPRTHGVRARAQLDEIVERSLRGAAIWDETKDRLKKSALSLSGGQQQRVCIARALAAEPEVLLMDEPTSALVLLLDVTERQATERLRREFSANVSHELKTPLTSISGYAEMIAGGLVRPADVRGFAERIHREAGRLLTLIEDIMKLSRLDEGGDAPAHEPVELLALARQAAERLELRAQALGVTVRVSGENAVVVGAYSQLFELIFNLTENAVKYNRAGGSVSVTVQPNPAGALLTVADTGIGIPADAQARVFERFYRVDKSRSTDTGGTGLGLSIAKHIVRLHGAQLTLESAEGHGTVVRVRFTDANARHMPPAPQA